MCVILDVVKFSKSKGMFTEGVSGRSCDFTLSNIFLTLYSFLVKSRIPNPAENHDSVRTERNGLMGFWITQKLRRDRFSGQELRVMFYRPEEMPRYESGGLPPGRSPGSPLSKRLREKTRQTRKKQRKVPEFRSTAVSFEKTR